MLNELQEIKQLRKQHNLTQRQLANLAGVSQSLVAKIESGVIDPSYGNVRKLMSVLESIDEQNEKKAGDIMNKKIISVVPSTSVADSVKKMKQYDISQLPVIQGKFIVGVIAESDVLDAVQRGSDLKKTKVKELMNDAPPTIPEKTPQRTALNLLRVSPIIVVVENGSVKGVITKADVLKAF